MLVKLIVSAVGADFSLTYGQEFEFSELKQVIGNGAENFCVPVDPSAPWPPVVEQAVVPPAEIPEVAPVVETAVFAPVVETATKHRKQRR